ncbi:hypothetical protein [Streptomyces sp. NBC_01233]|uniref:hypothetical protein n=1 Tax=Streptomyces sp. NBC_01233 TaxID=2903787 RepID=UPI002E11B1C2|nr:hypothetical protein OG332_33775 [Streptomyces sp. NBC_01233]
MAEEKEEEEAAGEQLLGAAREELPAPPSAQERQRLTRPPGRTVPHHTYGDPTMGPGGQ